MTPASPLCMFPSRYRAAFHFRALKTEIKQRELAVFPSRYRAASHFRVPLLSYTTIYLWPSFHLVIERLLISGALLAGGENHVHGSFHLVIERLLISGRLPSSQPGTKWFGVSISLSSGFSFQGAFGTQTWCAGCMFPSRYRAASHFRRQNRNPNQTS